jgi:hypothetical protein
LLRFCCLEYLYRYLFFVVVVSFYVISLTYVLLLLLFTNCGRRKYGTSMYYLSKEGQMMFWGGECQRNVTLAQQRRAAQFNSHVVNARTLGAGTGSPIDHAAASSSVAASASSGPGTPGKDTKSSFAAQNDINYDEPILDFRVIAGAPLRSK